MDKGYFRTEYDILIQELEEKYNENPKETITALRHALITLNYSDNKNNINDNAIKSNNFKILDFDYYSSQIFIYIISFVILTSMFLFHIGGTNFEEGLGLYIFGAIFLIAGQSIGTFTPFFGLIFLFSHGGSGMGMMVSTFLSPILQNPLIADYPPPKLIYYIGAAFAFIVIGFLITVVRNLSNSFKEKYYSIFLPVIFYIIGVGMIAVLYRNLETMYQMLL